MKQCFAYTRVSTVKQGEGVSLQAQKEAIQAFAKQHNIEIVKWFEEKETAAKKGRPVFSAMLKELRQGGADGLVMHKIDRSARNFADWAKIGELADTGVDIHFATESLDFHSRGGRLTADIQAVIAADYIRNLRDETIKGINGRLKQGLYPFKSPLGYLDQGGGKPKFPCPVKAPLIRKLFELYATGKFSIRSLQKRMVTEGLRNFAGNPVTITGIETILNNPFYCGIIQIKRRGTTYPGVHQPLISPRLFQTVQDIKAGRHVGKKVTRHNYTFRGLFKCAECGLAAIAERQKGHVYYRCHNPTCPTKTVREELVDEAVAEALRFARLPRTSGASLIQCLSDRLQPHGTKPEPDSLQLRKDLVDTRLNKLTDALLDELIDADTFNTKKKALLLEQAKLADEIAERDAQPDITEAEVKNFLELVKNLYLTYRVARPAEKQQFAAIATSNRTISGKNAYAQPHNWLLRASDLLDVLSSAHFKDSCRKGRNETGRHFGRLAELVRSREVRKLAEIVSKYR